MTLSDQQRRDLHRLLTDELRAALASVEAEVRAASLAARRAALTAADQHDQGMPKGDTGFPA